MKLLTIPEVAELLSVSTPRAYELARRGIIPSVRLGRQVRVHPAELDRWISEGGDSSSSGSTSRA